MVVVEMTSGTPSYRLSEGGSFSFIMGESITFDKPFKTYEEMIEILESRNIVINDKQFAKDALKNFSYYGLVNGYKNTFLQNPGSNNFRAGTRFEELYTLHIIDTSLNNILLKYILYLEKALKSRISYLVSEKYGVYTNTHDLNGLDPKDYLYTRYYSNGTRRRINILIKLKQCISQTRNNPIMLHYLNHKNHVPAWILTTNISYGLTIEWYSILRNDDKTAICDSFITPGLLNANETKEFIKKALDLTKEYRNKIAHGNRTFSILNLPQLPKRQLLALTYHTISESEYNSKMGQDDTLAVILALIIMLKDPYIVANFVAELQNTLLPYHDTSFNGSTVFELLGFPNNLFERLQKLMQQKYT